MSDLQPTPPLPNDPAARTPDGTLKDAQAPTIQDSTPSPTPTNPESKPDAKPAEPATPDGPPAEYKFTAPEGKTYDETTIKSATTIAKELGLSQAQADKLISFRDQIAAESLTAVKSMREGWVAQVKADPEIGGKLDAVTTDIGRAINAIGDAKVIAEFKDAMNLTGAGDHPAFVKAFWKLSQLIVEGKPVNGGKPSALGQSPTGTKPVPTAAAAMYPNLPASTH